MSDEDFPAAHSMDTEWYAVDKDGNLGHFRTGEAGAAPDSALAGQDDPEGGVSLSAVIRSLSSKSGVEYEVDDLIAMEGGPVFDFSWRTRQYESASFSDAASCYCVLMLFASEMKFSELQGRVASAASRATGRRSAALRVDRIVNSKYILGYVDGPLPVGSLQNWVEDQTILKAWVNHPLTAARIGIFEYEHGEVFENWIAGLYLRDRAPIKPLNVKDLPEALRNLFENTRFDRRSFIHHAAIDPREAGECTSWEQSWVGLDGLVNRVEGDDDY